MQENRDQRFKRIAQKRTEKVLDSIRLLGNCANKSTYSYSEIEVTKIFRAIDEELRLTKVKFKFSKTRKFSL